MQPHVCLGFFSKIDHLPFCLAGFRKYALVACLLRWLDCINNCCHRSFPRLRSSPVSLGKGSALYPAELRRTKLGHMYTPVYRSMRCPPPRRGQTGIIQESREDDYSLKSRVNGRDSMLKGVIQFTQKQLLQFYIFNILLYS